MIGLPRCERGVSSIEGVDLNMIQMGVEEMFFRVFHHHEFDVVEMSLSSYMMARSKGEWEYEAIPVFLSRMFRHSAIFVGPIAASRVPLTCGAAALASRNMRRPRR